MRLSNVKEDNNNMSASSFIVSGGMPVNNLPEQPISVIIFQKLKNLELDQLQINEARTGKKFKQKEIFDDIVRFAIALQKFGIKPGDLAVIISENCYKFIIASISLHLLGAKTEFLNPEYTTNELRHYFNIAPPNFVCCSLQSLKNVEILKNDYHYSIICFDRNNHTSSALCYDDMLTGISTKEINNFHPVDVKIDEVATLFSSSGTTGLPKLIELSHGALQINTLMWNEPNLIEFTPNDSTILYLPFFHIFGYIILACSLVSGVTTVIMDKFHSETFVKLIETHRVNKLFTVPPVLMFLANTPLLEKYDVSSIKDITCAAAPLKKELEKIVTKRLNSPITRQLYGLTEATGAVTITPKNGLKYGTVGKPIPFYDIKICDIETDEILGPNNVGELRIKSKALMLGYCGNVKETVAAFDRDGWLKTGDLGYIDDDGYFYIIDRIKEMIKYKGFQVAPVELENLLLSHPAVKDVAVVGIPDERAVEVPLAFVVKELEHNTESNELIQYVAENLSSQKHLYGGIRFVDSIPRNAAGKILRRKLKELL